MKLGSVNASISSAMVSDFWSPAIAAAAGFATRFAVRSAPVFFAAGILGFFGIFCFRERATGSMNYLFGHRTVFRPPP
jgi:hypothetical protein